MQKEMIKQIELICCDDR